MNPHRPRTSRSDHAALIPERRHRSRSRRRRRSALQRHSQRRLARACVVKMTLARTPATFSLAVVMRGCPISLDLARDHEHRRRAFASVARALYSRDRELTSSTTPTATGRSFRDRQKETRSGPRFGRLPLLSLSWTQSTTNGSGSSSKPEVLHSADRSRKSGTGSRRCGRCGRAIVRATTIDCPRSWARRR